MRLIEEIAKRHPGIDAEKFAVRSSILLEKQVKSQNGRDRLMLSAIATTNGVDLDDEVVVPAGGNPEPFMRMKSVYYGHDYSALPVGTLRSVSLMPDKSGWKLGVQMGTHDFARDVATCIEDGAINGGSIGFLRKVWGQPTQDEVKFYGPHSTITREWDWLEWSITPMPCNPEAMIESYESGKGMPMDEESERRISNLLQKHRISVDSAKMMGVKKRIIVVRPEIVI